MNQRQITPFPIVQYIQMTITPCLLVSATSLLLLNMTNRYTHLTNRIRNTTEYSQVVFLYQRILTMRYAIIGLLLSTLTSILLMVLFFEMLIHQRDVQLIIIILMTSDLGFLMLSILLFIYDMYQSTNAIHIIIQNLHLSQSLP